ncbi:MAG: DUF3144 domain-containing protein [Pseudomonadota bacterium]
MKPFSMPPDAEPPGTAEPGAAGEDVGEAGVTNQTMTPEQREEFFALADRFLALANEAASDGGPGRVSAAMMFACARFNAFTAQTQGLEGGTVDEGAVRYFSGEYEKMLRDNLGQTLIAQE